MNKLEHLKYDATTDWVPPYDNFTEIPGAKKIADWAADGGPHRLHLIQEVMKYYTATLGRDIRELRHDPYVLISLNPTEDGEENYSLYFIFKEDNNGTCYVITLKNADWFLPFD